MRRAEQDEGRRAPVELKQERCFVGTEITPSSEQAVCREEKATIGRAVLGFDVVGVKYVCMVFCYEFALRFMLFAWR